MIKTRNKDTNTNGTTANKKKIRTPLLDRSNNKNVVNDEKPKKMSRFQELFMKSAKNTTVVYEDGLQKANQQKRNFEKSKDDIQNSIKDDQVRLVLSTKFVKQRKKSNNRMSNNSTSSLLLKKKEKNFQVIEKKKVTQTRSQQQKKRHIKESNVYNNAKRSKSTMWNDKRLDQKKQKMTRVERMKLASAQKKRIHMEHVQRERQARLNAKRLEEEKKIKDREERRLQYEEEMRVKRVLEDEERQRRRDDVKRRKLAYDQQVQLRLQKKERDLIENHNTYKSHTEEQKDLQKYQKKLHNKRRESIMIRAHEQKNVRSIKKLTREQRLQKEIENLREKSVIENETKYQLKQEETSIVKDIINENKRILEAEKNIKTDKKRQYLNVERDMIQWKEDTRLLEEELEASRRESVMPIASTGINKLKSMWKLFNEECIKEENVHPETM
eukprot:g14400.t1